MNKISLLFFVTLCFLIKSYSQNKYFLNDSTSKELINGHKNELRFFSESKYDSVKFEVSGGAIKQIVSKNMSFSNGLTKTSVDTFYIWEICEPKLSSLTLISKNFSNGKVVETDTNIFFLRPYPIIKSELIVYNNQYLSGLHQRYLIDGDKTTLVEFAGYFNAITLVSDYLKDDDIVIQGYRLNLYDIKNKFVKSFQIDGTITPDSILKKLIQYYGGSITIDQIRASLKCGLTLDINPIEGHKINFKKLPPANKN